jgi:hypothetical protein
MIQQDQWEEQPFWLKFSLWIMVQHAICNIYSLRKGVLVALWKVSEWLVFTQNWVKLHQTSCKHKLNVFLNKIEYADNYHIWKPKTFGFFVVYEQNPKG